MLKEIDKEYRATIINLTKYHIIMFVMAKIMENDKIRTKSIGFVFV